MTPFRSQAQLQIRNVCMLTFLWNFSNLWNRFRKVKGLIKDSFAVLLAPGANRPLAQDIYALVHISSADYKREVFSSYRFRRPLGRTGFKSSSAAVLGFETCWHFFETFRCFEHIYVLKKDSKKCHIDVMHVNSWMKLFESLKQVSKKCHYSLEINYFSKELLLKE